MKVEVSIEETLCRIVTIEVPDNLDADERMEKAEEIAKKMYFDEEIVLTADDFNGSRCMEIHDIESDRYTGWNDF